jgi:catechol 2,3-dioxygenase-like lactoylglutathione lyase family enzyme
VHPAKITTAFIPVADPAASADWYSRMFRLRIDSTDEWSAVLRSGEGVGSTALTLLGPASGIQAAPGLNWATCNFAVTELDQVRVDLQRQGLEPSAIEGTAEMVRFFTLRDPDGNTLLVTDR